MSQSLLQRIANGRTDLIWDLLASGHVATDRTADGVRLLDWCAYYGDVSALRLLLDRGETVASLGSDLGLRGAAFHGHWQLCEFLLEQGADVNASDPETGETALHSALCTPHRERHDLVIRVLLTAGANPNLPTMPGKETGAFMRDARTRGETALHRAAAFGSEATVQLLLDAGAKREAKDANGDTPLTWGSWYARPDVVLRLLCFGPHRIHPQRIPMRQALLGTPQSAKK